MGRPLKTGLDYFPLDTNFLQDVKIKKLLLNYEGGKGVSVYIYLLARIYKEWYFIEWNEDWCFSISYDLQLSEEFVQKCVDFMVGIGLFDKDLYINKNILTSHGIQVQYFLIVRLNKRKRPSPLPYLLIELPQEETEFTQEETKFTPEKTINNDKKRQKSLPQEETEFTPEETKLPQEETEFTQEEGAQNKINKNKGKKSKDNNSLRSSLSPSTSPSSVCVCEMEQEKLVDIPMTAREGIEVLKKDRDWLLQMQRKFGLDAGSLVRWLESFSVDCDCRGKQEHENLADVKQHFNDWMSKQKPKRNGGKKGADDDSAPLTSQQRWNKCHAELCHAVSPEVSCLSFDVIHFERFDDSTSELFIQVPNKETYKYMEHHLVDVMSRIIPKYFGANFKLQYHLP